MAKTLYLNGHTFTVHKHRDSANALADINRYAGRTIHDCYSRPSSAKLYIYDEWAAWAYLNDVQHFGVCSYNGFNFSLQGVVEHGGHTYLLHITKAANRAYILD